MNAAKIRQQIQEIREQADPKRPAFGSGLTDDNGELYGIKSRGELYMRDHDETPGAFRLRARTEAGARPLVLFVRDGE